MIIVASLALAGYEALACATHLPKVTDLSHRRYTAPVILGWWFWLGIHFLLAARR